MIDLERFARLNLVTPKDPEFWNCYLLKWACALVKEFIMEEVV
jgi:hypothetical protein